MFHIVSPKWLTVERMANKTRCDGGGGARKFLINADFYDLEKRN